MATATSDPRLEGEVLYPHSPGYDSARRIWNAGIDRRPGLIARPRTAGQVTAAVRYARGAELPLAIRGGGHSVAGHSVLDGGVMIDLSGMKRVKVDPKRRVASVEPGVLLGELDAATQEHGLAVPAGTISHTGVAGLTLGGGLGWLMRKHGLTIDSLIGVELVTADGSLLRASEDENTELFWAIRGAGANFGVVTEFEFRLHEVGPTVLGGMLVYRVAQAAEMLRAARDLVADAPDELTTFFVLLTAPPHPPFPQELWGQRVLVVSPAWCGPLEEGEREIGRLRAVAEPALDLVGPLPYLALQSMIDETAPHGLHHYNAAEMLGDLGDAAIDAVVGAFEHVTSPRSHLILSQMGGAVGRVAVPATAFAHREAAYTLWILNMWEPSDESPRHRRWTRATADAVRPFAMGGAYVNALGDEPQDRVRLSYGPNWDRLVELKRRYDPENVFRRNANVSV
jgi:FAD/FMN-containing dehydrogenase